MHLYKVILLLNLALGVGVFLGSIWWGWEVGRLRREVAALRQSAHTALPAPGEWSAQGIVRLISPELNRVFIDHSAIPGLMEGMTMAFEPEDSHLLDGLSTGDRVRFTLHQRGSRLFLVAIEKWGDPAGLTSGAP